MPKSENRDALDALFRRLRKDFGDAGDAIIRTIIEELGGLRVTVPDLHDLFIEERNRRIRAEFTGNNYEELALRFTSRTGVHLSVRQIRYIIDGERGPGKKS